MAAAASALVAIAWRASRFWHKADMRCRIISMISAAFDP
jgi:hypothetical protein